LPSGFVLAVLASVPSIPRWVLVRRLPKVKRTINGEDMILEYGLKADYAFIRAHKADTMGNLVYTGIMRTFNAVMATAADVVVAEVDEIVEPGELDPEIIVTPGIFVDRVVKIGKGDLR
jgi:3-oxoacid CoA-transferase A subunit